MHKLGFYEKWVASIILACIHTQKSRIFVNKISFGKEASYQAEIFPAIFVSNSRQESQGEGRSIQRSQPSRHAQVRHWSSLTARAKSFVQPTKQMQGMTDEQ